MLLSAPGKVYVSYQGDLYLFKAKAQLAEDGYGGTAAVPVPGTGGLNVFTVLQGHRALAGFASQWGYVSVVPGLGRH